MLIYNNLTKGNIITQQEFDVQKALGIYPQEVFLYYCNSNRCRYYYIPPVPHITIAYKHLDFTKCLRCGNGFYHSKDATFSVVIINPDDDSLSITFKRPVNHCTITRKTYLTMKKENII